MSIFANLGFYEKNIVTNPDLDNFTKSFYINQDGVEVIKGMSSWNAGLIGGMGNPNINVWRLYPVNPEQEYWGFMGNFNFSGQTRATLILGFYSTVFPEGMTINFPGKNLGFSITGNIPDNYLVDNTSETISINYISTDQPTHLIYVTLEAEDIGFVTTAENTPGDSVFIANLSELEIQKLPC